MREESLEVFASCGNGGPCYFEDEGVPFKSSDDVGTWEQWTRCDGCGAVDTRPITGLVISGYAIDANNVTLLGALADPNAFLKRETNEHVTDHIARVLTFLFDIHAK